MKSGLEIISHHIFKTIGQAADNLNVECYVIGGFVRDQLLNRDCKDIDVVCVGSGIDLAIETARLCNLPEQAVNVFKNFGTAMFRFDEDWELEFVGARKESYDFNSRKPTVEEGSLEDDQNRRDFTINALAVGLNSDNWGKLIDPFEGLKDSESKTI